MQGNKIIIELIAKRSDRAALEPGRKGRVAGKEESKALLVCSGCILLQRTSKSTLYLKQEGKYWD